MSVKVQHHRDTFILLQLLINLKKKKKRGKRDFYTASRQKTQKIALIGSKVSRDRARREAEVSGEARRGEAREITEQDRKQDSQELVEGV